MSQPGQVTQDDGGWLSGACGPGDGADEAAVSYGPTFGPETGDDAAKPPAADERHRRRGWHPPGGSI